jgi:hypothetical protein
MKARKGKCNEWLAAGAGTVGLSSTFFSEKVGQCISLSPESEVRVKVHGL